MQEVYCAIMQPKDPTPSSKIEFNPKVSLTDEERLRIIADVSANAIFDWDIEAGVTRWNHGMRTLFGYAEDAVQTHNWWQERNPLRMIGTMVDITSRVHLVEAEIKSAIEERQRLARDLHYTVAQTLYSMTLLAEAVRRMANTGDLDQVQAYASRLGETAQQSLKEMRFIVYEMRASVLQKQGLAKAIQNRLDVVEKRSGIDVHFQTNLERKLPEPLEQGLFYIVSEALTNSLKHANATSVNVVMCVDGADEVAGLKLFIGEANCTNCHNGPLFTNNDFHNTGVPAVPDLPEDTGRALGAEQAMADEFNCLSVYSDAQPEHCTELRFLVLDEHQQERQFKPPSLRNVFNRGPFMHAGQFATLEEVLNHYNTAPEAPAGHSELEPLNLSEKQIAQIIAFLKTLDGPIDTNLESLMQPK